MRTFIIHHEIPNLGETEKRRNGKKKRRPKRVIQFYQNVSSCSVRLFYDRKKECRCLEANLRLSVWLAKQRLTFTSYVCYLRLLCECHFPAEGSVMFDAVLYLFLISYDWHL